MIRTWSIGLLAYNSQIVFRTFPWIQNSHLLPQSPRFSQQFSHLKTFTFIILSAWKMGPIYHQFGSVVQSCLTLCDPMNCSTPGLPVHHQLPEFTQIHVHRVGDAIQPLSSSVVPFSSCPRSFPASGSFQMNQLFASGGQSIGVSASASVLPMNTQDWSPLGWTGWISLQSKGLSRVFSNTRVQNHQFFSAQLSSQPNSHVHTWPLEKP